MNIPEAQQIIDAETDRRLQEFQGGLASQSPSAVHTMRCDVRRRMIGGAEPFSQVEGLVR